MGAYYLNGKDLADYGLKPGQYRPGNLAIKGCWDMPARINKTYQDWGDDHGIEAYVDEAEIMFGGRDITVSCWLKAQDKNDATLKLYDLYADIDALTDLVTLSCSWGSWQVYVGKAISVQFIAQGLCSVELAFREPVADLSGTIPAASNAVIGIDDIAFSDLGFTPLKLSGNQDRAETKQQQFTNYETEGYQITPRQQREMVLTGYIKKATYADFNAAIKSLYALLASPGLRTLSLNNDPARDFFVKDGFEVSNVTVQPDFVFGQVDIKISGQGVWYNMAFPNGDIITDQDFNNLLIKVQ